MIRVGATLNKVEITASDRELADSDEGIGWEIGGGVVFPIDRITVTPGVRFRGIKRDFDVGGTLVPASFGYAIAELGIGFVF